MIIIDTYENEKMGILKRFINSIYDFKSYNFFISQKLSKAILYLLLLAFLSSTFTVIKNSYTFKSGFSYLEEVLTNEMPSFILENNELKIDTTMPIVYEDGINIVVVDTTKELDPTTYPSYINIFLIGKDKIIFKDSSSQFTTLDYSSFQLTSPLTSEDFSNVMKTLGGIGITILLILIFIFLFIGKLISVFLIMPLAALVISSILDKKLSYGSLIKISAYALTVPIIIKTFFAVIGVNVPVFFILYYGVGIIYLTFAIKNIKLDINDSLESTLN